jgi:hypothetical protein
VGHQQDRLTVLQEQLYLMVENALMKVDALSEPGMMNQLLAGAANVDVVDQVGFDLAGGSTTVYESSH